MWLFLRTLALQDLSWEDKHDSTLRGDRAFRTSAMQIFGPSVAENPVEILSIYCANNTYATYAVFVQIGC